MDTRLMKQIKDILKGFPQYWNGEELQRPIVISDLKNYDALLISELLKNQRIRENYSIKAGDVVIFKVQEFVDILRYKDYWADSYTKYSNTIGLSSEGKYLQSNTDVVLDFPYKDCVLEGGMTKEDVGKNEVFYNEVIARDEIDTLFSPKVLMNAKKYNENGERETSIFTQEDNLIIKGNNLLALHSLKERYAGKVKLIYIDPPYNTGGDSFKYNDRFNHSTWLTFMKNRLEISKELLSEDGSIWINIDDDEGHYLKILADSIFLRENFINTVIWEKKYTISNDATYFSDNHDMILVYSKNKTSFKLNKLARTKKMNAAYKNPDNHPKGVWKATPLHAKSGSVSAGKFTYKFLNGVLWTPPEGTYPRFSRETLDFLDKSDEIWFGKDGQSVPSRKTFLTELKNNGVPSKTIWRFEEVGHNHEAREEVKKLNPVNVFSTPKPEKLLQRIIHLGSDENDIVLDFFMGSATTQAVAMKMNRQYIGIEQMNYINTVSVPRLQKVIEGEQGGISKKVDWQGGGSFVYAELMELNQVYVTKIDEASTKEELADLWNDLSNNADLNFQLDKEKLTNELLRERDDESDSITFNDLTFEEQKEIFKKALDKNQLYVPYSEIDDDNVVLSDNDKAFNRSFYNSEGE